MTPEERELLNKALRLSEENNRLLRNMRRSARLSSFLRLVYWCFIIIVAFYAYINIIEPIIKPMISGYNEIQKNLKTISNATSKIPEIPSLSLPSWLGGEKK